MTLRQACTELALVSEAPALPEPEPEERERATAEPAPKRMAKRCRRCGKTVPTVGGLVWRTKRLVADLEALAGQVLDARVAATDDAARERALKDAQATQHESGASAKKLLADLRRLQAHERRCAADARSLHAAPGAPPAGRR
jgi:hypothetical protein